MKKITKTIEIPESEISFSLLSDLKKILESYAGKTINLTFEVKRKKRSNAQNAYWWGVVVPLIQAGINEHGDSISQEQTHDFLKREFLTYDVPITDDGEFIEITKNTSGLDTFEFNELIEKVQIWSAEMLGVIVPDPNENVTFDSN